MAEVRKSEKVSELSVVLSRRIKENDGELVLEMRSYLSNFSKLHIDKLYKNLIVNRRGA